MRPQHRRKGDRHRRPLSGHRRNRRPGDPHLGAAEEAEDQDRVEDDVEKRPQNLRRHRQEGVPPGLQNLRAVGLDEAAGREEDDDAPVGYPHLPHQRVVRRHREVGPQHQHPGGGKEDVVEDAGQKAVADKHPGLFPLPVQSGDEDPDPGPRPGRHRGDQQLERVDDRQRRQPFRRVPADKKAVDDVVDRLD